MGFSTRALAYTALTGTQHLYVDAANGSDASSGRGGWWNAWKTAARLIAGLRDLFLVPPFDYSVYVHARGHFGAADHLRIVMSVPKGSSVTIGCDAADCTVVQDGTVAAVATSTLESALCEVDFTGGGVVLTGPDEEGLLVQFDDGAGGHVGTFEINYADPATDKALLALRGASKPAWLVGGGTVNAKILTTEAVFEGEIDLRVQAERYGAFNLLNVRSYVDVTITGSRGVGVAVDARNAAGTRKPITFTLCSECHYFTSYYVPSAILEAFGYIGVGGANADFALGSNAGTWTANDSYGCYQMGRFTSIQIGGYYNVASFCATQQVIHRQGKSQVTYSLFFPVGTTTPILCDSGLATFKDCNVLRVPAAGFVGALVRAEGGRIQLDDVEGNNTGTGGSGLYGVIARPGGTVEVDSVTVTKLKAKHGQFRNEGGKIRFTENSSVGSAEGGGPDVYNENGDLQFDGNFNKAAVNTAGGGAANKFVDSLNGRVSQLAGKTMTVATPPGAPGDWPTEYGVGGAIRLRQSKARLGALTGGAAGTTGVGCTVDDASSLVHEGAGLLGAGPLSLGGSGAGAWPGAGTTATDVGAGNPQLCLVRPV
jgi:hypothetical protein